MPDATVAEFYDDFSERLLADFFVPNARVHAQYRFLREAIVEDASSILVIGCGTGEVAWLLAERFAHAKVVALDISAENIQTAQTLFRHERVEFLCRDALSLAASEERMGPEGGFSAVVFPDSYEHFRAADRALLHTVVSRLLAPRGRVLLACPTPMKQQQLREAGHGLQVIDEDVSLADVQQLAHDVAGIVAYYALVQVWGYCDYFHAAIERGLERMVEPASVPTVKLHRGQTRWEQLLRNSTERLRVLARPKLAVRALRLAAGSGGLPGAKRVLLKGALGLAERVASGPGRRCPICGVEVRMFLPFGVGLSWRADAWCPGCQSLERHRLVWLKLRSRLAESKPRLLHVAPERCLEPLLRQQLGGTYVTTDLMAPGVDVQSSLEDLPFPDASFDAVICNHVLEHVTDDRRALGELRRVLRPGGWAILQVPLKPGLERTLEDASVTSAAERRRRFGQSDHVRWYGADYPERLEACGFRVAPEPVPSGYSNEEIARFGLDEHETFYAVVRPSSD